MRKSLQFMTLCCFFPFHGTFCTTIASLEILLLLHHIFQKIFRSCCSLQHILWELSREQAAESSGRWRIYFCIYNFSFILRASARELFNSKLWRRNGFSRDFVNKNKEQVAKCAACVELSFNLAQPERIGRSDIKPSLFCLTIAHAPWTWKSKPNVALLSSNTWIQHPQTSRCVTQLLDCSPFCLFSTTVLFSLKWTHFRQKLCYLLKLCEFHFNFRLFCL